MRFVEHMRRVAHFSCVEILAYYVMSGLALERYFQKKMAEEGLWTRIGSWWDRRGENEIDLIAESELDGTSSTRRYGSFGGRALPE